MLEVPVYVMIARNTVPVWRAALAGAAGSCLTHPLLWLVWPSIVPHDYTTYIISGELLAATVESLTFFALARPIRFSRAVAASFIANAFSYGMGALVSHSGLLR